MAAKKTESVVNADELKINMINLANEMIEQVRGKQVQDINETVAKVIDIYNSVK